MKTDLESVVLTLGEGDLSKDESDRIITAFTSSRDMELGRNDDTEFLVSIICRLIREGE